MTDVILTLNAGSSTLKWGLFHCDHQQEPVAEGVLESHAVEDVFAQIQQNWPQLNIIAAGHRVVHGGRDFMQPVLLNADILAQLEALVPLAPLHLRPEIGIIKAVTAFNPALPQIACFDTAFHATQPPQSQWFALPRSYYEDGVMRYGFHGLSYAYIASQLPELTPKAQGRVVVAHLGNGASMCAMKDGKSVATTMGFSALDGLMMGTRSGSVDPGVVLYLMQQQGMSSEQVHTLLYKESGLKGVSGISHDVRLLEQSDAPEAAFALQLFSHIAASKMASLLPAIGGLDVLVFTAGIGEHSAGIREQICTQNRWLGIRLDDEANRKGATRISADDSAVEVYVLPTDEELMIARHVAQLLNTKETQP
jgi:acetate kinase